jgi:membrane protease YdiL (CAAX protease family)
MVYSIDWQKNPDVEFEMVLQAFWFHLKSALTEELVFRGALLYILIERLGIKRGIVISSIVFGVYHCFTYGMLGSIVPMIYIFIITASMGLVWAFSFTKTASIFLAFGLHLGNNFLSALFSRSPTGSLIWVESSRVELSEWVNLFYLLAKGLAVPVLCFFFIQYLSNHRLNTPHEGHDTT